MAVSRISILAAPLLLFTLLTPSVRAQDLEATLKPMKVQDAECVQVVTVVPKGLAAQLGLREGDVIQKVNQETVRNPQEVLDKIAASRKLTIDVLASGRVQVITAEIYWPPKPSAKEAKKQESQAQKKSPPSERDRRPVVINQKRGDR